MQWSARIGIVAILIASIAIGWLAGANRNHEHDLPGEALGSPFFLRLEHGFLAFVILLIVLVVVLRGVWRGDLPTKISQNSVEYEPIAAKTDVALGELKTYVDAELSVLKAVTKRQQMELDVFKRQGGAA